MKIDRFETHDRLLHFKKDQALNIFQGASDCLTKNPLSLAIQERSPYVYLFAHPRTDDDGVRKKMFWDPRLSIPTPETNSYLFRGISKTDLIQMCWMIPPREMWSQYEKGMITENPEVMWSVHQFMYNRKLLQDPHPDDMPEEKAKLILKAVIDEHIQKIRSKKYQKV
jgi:hypothetical protein